jgi:hypothetical protein
MPLRRTGIAQAISTMQNPGSDAGVFVAHLPFIQAAFVVEFVVG